MHGESFLLSSAFHRSKPIFFFDKSHSFCVIDILNTYIHTICVDPWNQSINPNWWQKNWMTKYNNKNKKHKINGMKNVRRCRVRVLQLNIAKLFSVVVKPTSWAMDRATTQSHIWNFVYSHCSHPFTLDHHDQMEELFCSAFTNTRIAMAPPSPHSVYLYPFVFDCFIR